LGVLSILGAAVWLTRKRTPLISFGLVWLVAWLVPGLMLILLAAVGQPMAERRTYLASCGLFVAVASLVVTWAHSEQPGSRLAQKRFVAAAALIVVVLAGLTQMRLRVWSDPVILWSDAVNKAPGTWIAQFGLADAYQLVGDCESAIPAYRRAIALVPDNPQAYDGLAACLSELDRRDEAREVLRVAIQRMPASTHARVSLANLEVQAQHRAEALRLCREVQALAPTSPDAAACAAR
jgi:Tfp pilus assembly protein PilF